MRAGFDKQQASVGFPFAAASFEREHKERQAGASDKKQLQMIGRWYYPRVQLNLKECATASERFKTAIRSALDAYDKSTDIKPLLKVFEELRNRGSEQGDPWWRSCFSSTRRITKAR